MAEFDAVQLFVAFAGGLLGAALGGLNAFILCGLSAVVGTAMIMVTGDATFNETITWGPLLGPHVAFAGGIAAAAFAARKGPLCSGRNVLVALFGFNEPVILLVGGLFGGLGYSLKWALDLVPNIGNQPWTNTMALTVTLSTIIARLMFGKTGLFGHVGEGGSRWHFSREEAWQPWPSKPFQVLLVGIGISGPAAYLVKSFPTATGLFFGIGALSLIFFQFGAKIPVMLHIALISEVITTTTGYAGWGIAMGLLAAFLTEIFACLFLIHGDTHIDPPAMSIATVFSFFAVLQATGALTVNGIMPYIIALLISIVGVTVLRRLQNQTV